MKTQDDDVAARPSRGRGDPDWFPEASRDSPAPAGWDPGGPTQGRVSVGARGELQLSEAQRLRWGVSPGDEFAIEEAPGGLYLRRADPVLSRVYVEPTTACNLACRTCIRHAWREPEGQMEMATFQRLVEGLRAVPTLRTMAFWGFGEPLLHPGILDMLAMANGLGVEAELVTNGLLLDRPMAEGLVRVGLDRLVVSVDGCSVEALSGIRPGADLDVLLKNVEGLHAARRRSGSEAPEIGLEFVVMRRNVGELCNLRRLAHKMGASFVVVTNVLPYTEELKDEIIYRLAVHNSYPAPRSVWRPEIMLPSVDAQPEALEPMIALLRGGGAIDLTSRETRPAGPYCRFVGEGAAAVGWDGGVSPCVALMHSYPCYVLGRRKEIQRCTFGNVGSEPLARIWQREEYVRFRARVRRFEFAPCSECGGCEMAESNQEDCFGNPFPVCGDCLWAKGVIQCP